MKIGTIIICTLAAAALLPLASCQKDNEGTYVILLVASRKGQYPVAAKTEFFYVKEKGRSWWSDWNSSAFNEYEKGYEYEVLVLKYDPHFGEVICGPHSTYRLIKVLSKTKKESEGLPADSLFYP